jgi:cation diffusion facilitator CzcD-associated flavoprotein CzcO
LTQLPGKSFAILEAKDDIGGTWHTHKYPGARSDSDLYTFGYRFKPWIGPPIATAEEIRKYLRDVLAENDLDSSIRFSTVITRCSWSSAEKLWTVETRTPGGAAGPTYRANFLWMCQGYYDHENPYLPAWPGAGDFKGLLVHAANHVFAPALHHDESGVAELLEMETDGRRDLVGTGDATTHFANGWARNLSNLSSVCNR